MEEVMLVPRGSPEKASARCSPIHVSLDHCGRETDEGGSAGRTRPVEGAAYPLWCSSARMPTSCPYPSAGASVSSRMSSMLPPPGTSGCSTTPAGPRRPRRGRWCPRRCRARSVGTPMIRPMITPPGSVEPVHNSSTFNLRPAIADSHLDVEGPEFAVDGHRWALSIRWIPW